MVLTFIFPSLIVFYLEFYKNHAFNLTINDCFLKTCRVFLSFVTHYTVLLSVICTYIQISCFTYRIPEAADLKAVLSPYQRTIYYLIGGSLFLQMFIFFSSLLFTLLVMFNTLNMINNKICTTVNLIVISFVVIIINRGC